MLDVSHLSRSYADFKAVDDVSFSVGNGEIVGLLGHNGAGKTTVMKMLTGFLEPDSGSVTIAGKSLATRLKEVQRELGYLPENLPVYPEMTIADYLDYAARLKGISSKEKQSEISRVVRETDLAEKFINPIATLSRGYRQRVGVAQALLGKPRLLIMDEPTNGLDPTQTEQMRQLLRNIAQDATVILSTHIMQEVEALCDRVLMLSGGQLVLDERLTDLQSSGQLKIDTSLDHQMMKKILAGIEGAGLQSESEEMQGVFTYSLNLNPHFEYRSVSAAIAAAIAAAGGDLYSLHVARRDLEGLFREVNLTQTNNSAEVADAA
ncbi:multidrug ABC transporter ATP-binding protein [Chromatiales bacterium (ex Bugula neritina AB1)]|nr:multidrug ABC transporter ATP-binding protein [Chromatiales bacterium (ex Bugula neritina AB1)]